MFKLIPRQIDIGKDSNLLNGSKTFAKGVLKAVFASALMSILL
jgi:hypothetical protein